MKSKSIIFLFIGLGALAYILASMDVNIGKVIGSIKSPEYVIFAALVLTAIPFVNALRMRFIIFPLERKKFPVFDLSQIEYIYKFISNVMPFKLNLPAKAVLLSKKCGMKLSSGASVVSFEYALDSGVTIFFGFLGVVSYFRNDPRISLLSIQYFILIVLVCSVVFFSIPSQYFEKALSYTETIRFKAAKKIAIFFMKVMNAIRISWARILFDRKMFAVLFTTILIWAGAVLVNLLLFMATNNYVPPTWILVVMSLGIFVGGISTIPNGLGVRDATMVLLYNTLGVSTEASVASVLMGRLITVIPILVGYAISMRAGAELLVEKIT